MSGKVAVFFRDDIDEIRAGASVARALGMPHVAPEDGASAIVVLDVNAEEKEQREAKLREIGRLLDRRGARLWAAVALGLTGAPPEREG